VNDAELAAALEAERAHADRLADMLRDARTEYWDACYQGTGNEPLSSPTWHNFLSTYEYATELIPQIDQALADHDQRRRE
jgi:hypothetical protein